MNKSTFSMVLLCTTLSACRSDNNAIDHNQQPTSRSTNISAVGGGSPSHATPSPTPSSSDEITINQFINTLSGGSTTDTPTLNVTPVQPSGDQQLLLDSNHLRTTSHKNALRRDQDLVTYATLAAKLIAHGQDVSNLQGWEGGEYHVMATEEKSSQDAVKKWASLPNERSNLLSNHFTRIGAASFTNPTTGKKYFVQVLADDKTTPNYLSDMQSPPDIADLLKDHYEVSATDIDLSDGVSEDNSASEAAANGQLVHPIYQAARRYAGKEVDVIVQEPKNAFHYQTFGEVVNKQGKPIAYTTIGKKTALDSPTTAIKGHFVGASLGNVGGHSHVYSDVTADVDFSRNKQAMTIAFSNSKIANNDIATGKATALKTAKDFDLASTQLQWQKDHFTGSGIDAAFYGQGGQEIGGTFNRTVNNENYQGVFGLQRK